MPMSSTASVGLCSRASASACSPLARRHDVEPVAAQTRRHEQEDVVVVVGDEDREARSCHELRVCRLRSHARRQLDVEGRAAAFARRRGDRSAVRLDDRPRDEQAEAGARAPAARRRATSGRSGRTRARPRPGRDRCPCRSPRARRRRLAATTRTSTRPPSGVNLIAFEMRLSSNWKSRPLSPSIITGEPPMNSSSSCLASARGRASWAACAAIVHRSRSDRSRTSRPACSRATKSRSSTSRSSRSELRDTICR